MQRALVVLNPRAHRGAAVRAYDRVRSDVEAGLHVRQTLLDDAGQWLHAIDRARREGVERIVAVGGDGTVHAVGNAILNAEAWDGMALGAVALGSSNDFHKPRRAHVRGVPVRIGAPRASDAGLATFEDDAGTVQRRWFFVSGSLGLTARANRRFGAAAWLGARSVGGAIAWAAAGALLRHENLRARMLERDVSLSNLGVMLTPYLAGAFRYDTNVQRRPGTFALHLAEGMGKLGLVRAISALLRGGHAPKLASWSARVLNVELDREDDLELDGELYRARKVRFEALRDALGVCS